MEDRPPRRKSDMERTTAYRFESGHVLSKNYYSSAANSNSIALVLYKKVQESIITSIVEIVELWLYQSNRHDLHEEN